VRAASGYTEPFHLVLVRPHRVFTEADSASTVADLGSAVVVDDVVDVVDVVVVVVVVVDVVVVVVVDVV
jgi:hypothetical protein